MVYADDVGLVPRLAEGLANAKVFVEVCEAIGPTVSDKKTETMPTS